MLTRVIIEGDLTIKFTDVEITIKIIYNDNHNTNTLNIECSIESVKICTPEITGYIVFPKNILSVITKNGKKYEIAAEDLLSAAGDWLLSIDLINLLRNNVIQIDESFISFLTSVGAEFDWDAILKNM